MSWQQQRWALQIHQASGALFLLLIHGRYKDLRLGFVHLYISDQTLQGAKDTAGPLASCGTLSDGDAAAQERGEGSGVDLAGLQMPDTKRHTQPKKSSLRTFKVGSLLLRQCTSLAEQSEHQSRPVLSAAADVAAIFFGKAYTLHAFNLSITMLRTLKL